MKNGMEQDWRYDQLRSARDPNWRKERFQPQDALVYRTGMSCRYHGQPFSSQAAEIRKGGWDHEHCLGCQAKIGAGAEGCSEAYVNRHEEWICPQCYQDFFAE